jgi:hypothetical protein
LTARLWEHLAADRVETVANAITCGAATSARTPRRCSASAAAPTAMHHLSYEIRMLDGTYRLIPRDKNVIGLEKVKGQAYLESFCVHARASFEFFRKEQARREYTTDYVGIGYEKKWQQKLNEQVMHVYLPGRSRLMRCGRPTTLCLRPSRQR